MHTHCKYVTTAHKYVTKLHTSILQVYYNCTLSKVPSLYKLHCESLCLQWEQFYFLPDCVSILILQFAILKSGFQFWDTAKQNYHDSCKSWRELNFFSWRDILNEISFFPESIRCCFLSWSFSPLLQNRKTTCSRILNTHWFQLGGLADWFTAGASVRIFPFFHFSEQAGGGVLISFNKRTQNFIVCTWNVFGQSWEVFFLFFKSYIEFEHKWSKKVHKIGGIF